MIETAIQLKPREQWRPGLTTADLIAELDRIVKLPGLSNAWVMPIKNRINMLATGIKTPLGVKVAAVTRRSFNRSANGWNRSSVRFPARHRSIPNG